MEVLEEQRKLEAGAINPAELLKQTEQILENRLETIKQDFELKLSQGLEVVREGYDPRELRKDNKLIRQRTLKLMDAAIALKAQIEELKSLVECQRADGDAFRLEYEKQKEIFIRHHE